MAERERQRVVQSQGSKGNSLSTRPVSWTSPPAEAPEMRCSRIELTSEAAAGLKQRLVRWRGLCSAGSTHQAWR